MTNKFIWVFGNAVQDITVDVDIERLSRHPANKKGEMIRLTDRGPEINPNLTLVAQIGLQKFAVRMELENNAKVEKTADNWPILKGGSKYTLASEIGDPATLSISEAEILPIPCENLTWGGGGVNLTTFLRSLQPDRDKLPIRYTDIAMGRFLPDLTGELEATLASFGDSANSLYDARSAKSRKEADRQANRLAEIAARYSPERSLEVYLASLPVEALLHRVKEPKFRRNLVCRRFHAASPGREVNDKIILRGHTNDLPQNEQARIAEVLNLHADQVGAILLNSVKDAQMFKAAYSLCKSLTQQSREVVAIFAMTKAMQEFTYWMLQDSSHDMDGKLPPFILVFNETEAHQFAEQLGGSFEPFVDQKDGLPDIKKFAEMALFLRGKFDPEKVPRIYVTLGPLGSLGVDASGHVVYVWRFAKSGATIYDTNGCGDAYCAAVALLEWAKRHDHPNIAKVDFGSELAPSAHEMEYFMAVATAAAYCKATHRQGRIHTADLKELLQHAHLASVILPTVEDLANLTPATRPECVDELFRLHEPSPARFHGVTDDLAELFN